MNTSHSECRNVIVQSGAFGEHSFAEVEFTGTDYSSDDLNPNTRVRSSKTGDRQYHSGQRQALHRDLAADDVRASILRPETVCKRPQLRLSLARRRGPGRVGGWGPA